MTRVLHLTATILAACSAVILAGVSSPEQKDANAYRDVFRHTRSIQDRVFEVWRSPGRFTKNPDIVALSRRLLLVYADTDRHLSQENQVLTLLASDDQGRSWFRFREVARHAFNKGEERLVTPRLSRLTDGRLAVLVDQDDYGHFHEDQPPGILVFWSKDDGDTWSKEENTGIQGFEPDRMIELPDGRLAVCSHLVLGDTQEYAEIISCSRDGGKTWRREAIIAHDGYHRFCEGALVVMNGGKELACVMRETRSAGMPSFVAFSQDGGKNWSRPQELPFAFHRPYAKLLKDGRVLVTGRNVNGGLGTYAWVGDLNAEAGRYEIGGPRQAYSAELRPEALVIQNLPRNECRYTLLPPESSRSEVIFEAEMKVEGPRGQPAAFMSVNKIMTKVGPIVLWIAPGWIALSEHGVDFQKPVDMTDYRKVTLRHRRGLLQVLVDDRPMINSCAFWESYALRDAIGGDVTKRTQFGQWGERGSSFWKSVSYRVKDPSQPGFEWSWKAGDGRWPDQYQRDRLIQIHGNPPNQKQSPKHQPDHGYSSWLALKDGRILLVDYTNFSDPSGRSHLVGVYINPGDLDPLGIQPSSGRREAK